LNRGGRLNEQPAAEVQFGGTLAVGEEAVVVDATAYERLHNL